MPKSDCFTIQMVTLEMSFPFSAVSNADIFAANWCLVSYDPVDLAWISAEKTEWAEWWMIFLPLGIRKISSDGSKP